MGKSGEELRVEKHELWLVAGSFREMGAAHTEASTAVADVSVKGAFTRPDSLGTGATGPYDAFAYLQERVVGVLTRNGDSLNDTAEALDWCAEDYHATDKAVQDEFDRLKGKVPR